MKLHLTKKEYRALLDLIETGDWIIHSRDNPSKEDLSTHKALMQKILSHAQEMQCDDLVIYDHQFEKYFETREYENFIINNYIDPYDEDNFWEELADRLARRDLERQLGEEKLYQMEPVERAQILFEKSVTYENEFEEHGLEYLAIVRDKLISN